jgi:hypothetical protein
MPTFLNQCLCENSCLFVGGSIMFATQSLWKVVDHAFEWGWCGKVIFDKVVGTA